MPCREMTMKIHSFETFYHFSISHISNMMTEFSFMNPFVEFQFKKGVM